MISKEQLLTIVPPKIRNTISDKVVDDINNLLNDEGLSTAFKENLISYTSVLSEGRYTLEEYINAVKYVSFKAMGDTCKAAYCKVFPDRYNKWISNNLDDSRISSYISIYNKTKLVNSITERMLVPSWVLNQDIYQKAINTQAEIMCNPRASFTARSKAADSLLNALKRPEEQKIDLSVTQKDSESMLDLKASLKALVIQQQKLINSGCMSAKEIAEKNLVVEGEIISES